jgi:hypothetical protein
MIVVVCQFNKEHNFHQQMTSPIIVVDVMTSAANNVPSEPWIPFPTLARCPNFSIIYVTQIQYKWITL